MILSLFCLHYRKLQFLSKLGKFTQVIGSIAVDVFLFLGIEVSKRLLYFPEFLIKLTDIAVQSLSLCLIHNQVFLAIRYVCIDIYRFNFGLFFFVNGIICRSLDGILNLYGKVQLFSDLTDVVLYAFFHYTARVGILSQLYEEFGFIIDMELGIGAQYFDNYLFFGALFGLQLTKEGLCNRCCSQRANLSNTLDIALCHFGKDRIHVLVRNRTKARLNYGKSVRQLRGYHLFRNALKYLLHDGTRALHKRRVVGACPLSLKVPAACSDLKILDQVGHHKALLFDSRILVVILDGLLKELTIGRVLAVRLILQTIQLHFSALLLFNLFTKQGTKILIL